MIIKVNFSVLKHLNKNDDFITLSFSTCCEQENPLYYYFYVMFNTKSKQKGELLNCIPSSLVSLWQLKRLVWCVLAACHVLLLLLLFWLLFCNLVDWIKLVDWLKNKRNLIYYGNVTQASFKEKISYSTTIQGLNQRHWFQVKWLKSFLIQLYFFTLIYKTINKLLYYCYISTTH